MVTVWRRGWNILTHIEQLAMQGIMAVLPPEIAVFLDDFVAHSRLTPWSTTAQFKSRSRAQRPPVLATHTSDDFYYLGGALFDVGGKSVLVELLCMGPTPIRLDISQVYAISEAPILIGARAYCTSPLEHRQLAAADLLRSNNLPISHFENSQIITTGQPSQVVIEDIEWRLRCSLPHGLREFLSENGSVQVSSTRIADLRMIQSRFREFTIFVLGGTLTWSRVYGFIEGRVRDGLYLYDQESENLRLFGSEWNELLTTLLNSDEA